MTAPTVPARQRVLRVLVTLGFVALLAGVAVLNRAGSGAADGASDRLTAMARYGFRLEDVSRMAGIDFVHRGPTFDARLGHIMPNVASVGAAVAVADFDRDGWNDFYVTNSAAGTLNRLYRNRGDGTFEDVAGETGVADVNRAGSGVSMGAVWGDYDNDGYEDLLLYKYGRPELFRNLGGQSFRRVTEQAGLPAWVNSNTAIWLDFNLDGRLDLFLAGYWSESVDLWRLETTRIMPESFEYAENGGRKYLLRNEGGGVFADVTAAAGIDTRRWTLAAAAADVSGNGYPDLFLANDYGISQLYLNQDGRQFVEAGGQTGIGRAPKSGMNAAFGDVFNDGRLSIYETNISEPGILLQANNLWVPRAHDAAAELAYDNLASGLGVDLGGWSWGAQFGDLNNDGTLDLYLVNGNVSGEDRASYWYDFSRIAVGHSAIIADAGNWPPMRGRSLSGYQPARVWLNDGRGRFAEVAQVVGADDRHDGRAVALADLWNRGVLDVIVANQRGPLLVYRNAVAPDRHWLGVELRGTHGNPSAIGAVVELRWAGGRQRQVVSGGSGFAAQNQRRLHFGLGGHTAVDALVIRWPAGREQVIEAPAADLVHVITEQQ